MYNRWQPSLTAAAAKSHQSCPTMSKQKLSTLNNNSLSPQPEALLWKELLLGDLPSPEPSAPSAVTCHTHQNAVPGSSFRPSIYSDLKPKRSSASTCFFNLISQYCAFTMKKSGGQSHVMQYSDGILMQKKHTGKKTKKL